MRRGLAILTLILFLCFYSESEADLAAKQALREKYASAFEYQLQGQSVNVQWDYKDEEDVSGYFVYYGYTSKDYQFKVFVPKGQRNCILKRISTGKIYFFAVTAVDRDGKEGEFSDESLFTGGYLKDVKRIDETLTRLKIIGIPGWKVNIAFTDDGKKWKLKRVATIKDFEQKLFLKSPKAVLRRYWIVPQLQDEDPTSVE